MRDVAEIFCAKRCEKKSKCWTWELKCVSRSKVPFFSDLDMGQGLMQRLQKNMHIICLASLYMFFFRKKCTRCSSMRAFDTCRGVVVPSPATDVAAKSWESSPDD